MPATLAELATNRARLTVGDPDGAHIFVEYRPQAITPRAMRAFRDLHAWQARGLSDEEAMTLADDMTRLLASMLLAWDLLDPVTRQPIAPTLEGLQDVDYTTQGVILEAILQGSRVGKPSGTPPFMPSGSTSKRAAKRPASSHRPRSGTASNR